MRDKDLLKDVEDKDIDKNLNEECSDYCETEDIMEQLAIQEEIKRIEIQDNPYSEESNETKDSDFYKESMIIAETVGAVFGKLIGFGIDYNNALTVATQIMTNAEILKTTKITSVTSQQNQI